MRRRFEPIEPSETIFTGADVAEGAHVGAATQLERMPAGLEHAHDVAVLVAEERDRTELGGVVLGGLVVAHRVVGEDLVVGEVFDLADLLGRDRLEVAEVEPQAVGRDQRTLLLHVVAEHLAQRPVQDVGAGVVAPDRVAPIDIDRGRAFWPGRISPVGHAHDVTVQAPGSA